MVDEEILDAEQNDRKNSVFWYFTPCGSYMNPRFGVTHRLHLQGDKRYFFASYSNC
jgi:hypothetical protein